MTVLGYIDKGLVRQVSTPGCIHDSTGLYRYGVYYITSNIKAVNVYLTHIPVNHLSGSFRCGTSLYRYLIVMLKLLDL